MFRNYLKTAYRSIRKSVVFSLVNIGGLAVSIACCMVIALYVWNETQFDHFNKNINTIYRVVEKQDQAGVLYNAAVTPGPLAASLQKDVPGILNTVRFGKWSGVLKNGKQSLQQQDILLTDNSIFSVFSFPLVKGNSHKALQSPNDIIISESIAAKYFGSNWQKKDDLIGQTFRLNNETDFKLAGVIKDVPGNSSIRFDVLLPLSYLFATDKWSDQWGSNNFHTYIQVAPNTNVDGLQKKIANLLSTYKETKDRLVLQPLKDQYLKSDFDFNTDWGKRSEIKYITIFTGAGLLLLIIACINFINLSTARSVKRSLEVGVRKVNGASRAQLVFQFLTESVLLSVIAGILAVVLVMLVKPWFQNVTGIAISTAVMQPVFILLFVSFILITGCLAGLYPAFVLSSFKPGTALRKLHTSQSGISFRQFLVVGQFTISVSLIICTVFMYRQFRFMSQRDLGFDKEQLVKISLGGQLGGKAILFKQDVLSLPGVVSAAPATISMVNVDNSSYIDWEGMQAKDKFLITQANIDPAFIPVLSMKLLSGTNFSPQVTNDTATYILNESAVKRMGFTNTTVLNKQVDFWGAKGKVIGVVKDFNYKPLKNGIEPFIFRYQPQDRYFNLLVKIKPGKAQPVLTQIEALYKRYESEVPFQYSFISDDITETYKSDKHSAAVISLFAGLTILVSCLGLFGLSVYSVEQRVKEIGIRKVLGATLASIAQLLATDFLKLVMIAVVIAVPIAWYESHQWLQAYAYRTDLSWWVFAGAVSVVLLIALFTVSFQSLKAAIANPVKSLRTE